MTPHTPPDGASPGLHRPEHPVRLVTAASLFDGHDAAINVMRRLLQSQGAEVIHLGHDRSVQQVVAACIQEDVQGVAISSYQGGHMEYFTYLVDRLADEGRPDILVYGGGGGVIVPPEIQALQRYGVRRIFSPEDGQRLGLEAMVNVLIAECDRDLAKDLPEGVGEEALRQPRALARVITALEQGRLPPALLDELRQGALKRSVPVLGITGTGGSGKSSLTDELLLRFRMDYQDELAVAVLAVDPTRRRSGGALLGDRIRMNAIDASQIFFRSMATRGTTSELPPCLSDIIAACKAAGFDLVIVETPGIGQGDAAVMDVASTSLYVMTPEYGSASQLEKIDMLDLADVVAVNKYDRPGGPDAQRQVQRQRARSRPVTDGPESPVFATVASRFHDDGVSALYQYLADLLTTQGLRAPPGRLPKVTTMASTHASSIIGASRRAYLGEIADTLRRYHARSAQQAQVARRRQQLQEVRALAEGQGMDLSDLDQLVAEAEAQLAPESRQLLEEWPALAARYRSGGPSPAPGPQGPGRVSLSGTVVPRVALPRLSDHGDLLAWLRRENLPGRFPFTAGVFPLRRESEDPTRMFAGEGDPRRTNRRFHLLADQQNATRLSVAFDSVTLYGHDPARRPDIYGKVGTSGVSVATLEDMKVLFEGFDLCHPSTSVSMTINGPAPAILAMFFNTAIDQALDRFSKEHGRPPDASEEGAIRAEVFGRIRGTVQSDILKEDQGQNTCIFSTEFSLRVMADVQEYFIKHDIRHFYSVSISGYHIAEAGANPITQLAFTLANGFTYVEAFLERGMEIDHFAPNLSFFFSNGMDPEYTVLGRVARRIWAVAMRDRFAANQRSQRLKYHIQTSGRSLHAQEMSFNDIRTTLQALCAVYDNANSLHTNAYDEAVTTPTAESVRRAMAIQLIINREWGLAMNDNPLQGSFIVDELTDLVEEAVLAELDRLNERGGVLGAMETGYQRGRIQDDSLHYERKKHDGSLPIVGVNTFVKPDGTPATPGELARGSEEERQSQLARLEQFQTAHSEQAPAALARLQQCALQGGNVFATLMETVRYATLGQITQALFAVGGSYRRTV